jgi:ribonuclease D
MEITDANFNGQTLALVKKSIETADFIAIDTEFSGNFQLAANLI